MTMSNHSVITGRVPYLISSKPTSDNTIVSPARQQMNTSPFHRPHSDSAQTRREFLWADGGGLGGIALAALLGQEGALATPTSPGVLGGVLHHPAKAKRVVQLF